MELRKLKYNGDEVTLQWETRTKVPTPTGDGKPRTDTVAHALTSKDQPLPEFVEAVQWFLEELVKVLDLPPHWMEEAAESPGGLPPFHIMGVSINREGADDRLGVVFTLRKPLPTSKAPLILNSPHLRERFMDDPFGPGFMPDRWPAKLRLLEIAAERYVNGHRAQGDLFSDDRVVEVGAEDAAA